jgi:ABC-type phosphate/phosphonate transport system substrate-binding protein
MNKTLPLLAAGAALMAAAACSSTGNSGAVTPDEFRVVTKPPLSLPPGYSLRPPAPGTTIPAEVEGTGSVAAFGTVIGQSASAAERALVAAAGANAVNPAIRAQVDFEETRAIRKSPSIADRVLFWRADNPEDAESALNDNATGSQPVTIRQTGGGRRIKLPGT